MPSGKYEDVCPMCGGTLAADEAVRAGVYLQTAIREHVRVCRPCGKSLCEKVGLSMPSEGSLA